MATNHLVKEWLNQLVEPLTEVIKESAAVHPAAIIAPFYHDAAISAAELLSDLFWVIKAQDQAKNE